MKNVLSSLFFPGVFRGQNEETERRKERFSHPSAHLGYVRIVVHVSPLCLSDVQCNLCMSDSIQAIFLVENMRSC